MLRRMLILVTVCLLLCLPAAQAAQYGAMVDRTVNLRSEKGGGGVVITQVPKFGEVNVQEYGEDYSRVTYNKKAGYVATECLFAFRSQDPVNYPVPGHASSIGFVTLAKDTWISGGDFEGTMAPGGSILCLSGENGTSYTLPVWRDRVEIEKTVGTYTAFVPWQEAQRGDYIGGYTTFYGEQQGKGLAAERESNILLGCERLNNYVVKADVRLSFNKICGPYNSYNGYKNAPNVGGDGFGYGGGVCQLTTTLYNAILPLPCRLKDWCLHQYEGVVYVPQFFDAAVGKHDFSFLNQMPYNIRVEAMAQDGVLTVLISRE